MINYKSDKKKALKKNISINTHVHDQESIKEVFLLIII